MYTAPRSNNLYLKVLAGMVAGALIGHFFPAFGASLKPLGDVFIRLIKLLAAPVVFATVVTGIARMHSSESVGRTLLKAMVLFYVLSTAALLVGLVTVELLKPGVGMNVNPASLDPSFALKIAGGKAAPAGVVAFLSGFALVAIGDAGKPIVQFLESFVAMLFAMVAIVMRLAPLGALGAMAFTVGSYGVKSLGSLAFLMLSLYVACLVFIVGVLGLLAWAHGFSLWRFLRYLRDELLIVLCTSSVEPVLPRLRVKLQRLGCARAVVGLSE